MILYIKRMTFIIGAVFIFIYCGYSYFNSNIGLLSDKTLIGIISDSVLGNPEYGKSCTRASYQQKVISESGGGAGSAYLTFSPIKGEEDRCPLISIIASRRTGEAWIAGNTESK